MLYYEGNYYWFSTEGYVDARKRLLESGFTVKQSEAILLEIRLAFIDHKIGNE